MTPQPVAMTQRTFLSWTGWFDLAAQADLLIVVDEETTSDAIVRQCLIIRQTVTVAAGRSGG